MRSDGKIVFFEDKALEECPMPWDVMGKYLAAFLKLDSPSGQKNREWLEKCNEEQEVQAVI